MLSATAFSQDVIVKKDGSTILAKVISITKTDVLYKKYNNQKGSTYKIKKTELMCVNYKNGKKVTFDNSDPTPSKIEVKPEDFTQVLTTNGQAQQSNNNVVERTENTAQNVEQQQPLSDEEILRLYENEQREEKGRYLPDLPNSVLVDRNGKPLEEKDCKKLNTAYHILTRDFMGLTLYEQGVVAKALGIKRAKKQSEQTLRIAGINYKDYIIK